MTAPNSKTINYYGIKKYGIAILVLCFALRLLFFVLVSPWLPEVQQRVVLSTDAQCYHDIALSLGERGRFISDPVSGPDALRTPIYPLFLLSAYSLFGEKPWVGLLLQILVDTISCCLLMLSVYSCLGRRVALIAGLLYAVDSHLIQSCSTLLTDVLFMFFLVATLFWTTRGVKVKSAAAFGMAAFCLGVAALTRPGAHYAYVALVAFFIVAYWREWRTALKYTVMSAAVFTATVSPWLIRNHKNFGVVSLSTAGTHSMLVPRTIALIHAKDPRISNLEIRNRLKAEAERAAQADGLVFADLDPFKKADYWNRVASNYILNDPSAFIKANIKGTYRLFFTIGATGAIDMLRFERRGGTLGETDRLGRIRVFVTERHATRLFLSGLIGLYLCVTYFGVLVGLFVSWRKYDRRVLLLLVLFLVCFVLISGSAGVSRHKLPAIPFYLAFSGIGLVHLFDRVRSRARVDEPSTGATAG